MAGMGGYTAHATMYWLFYEATICLLMVAAWVILLVYRTKLANEVDIHPTYNMCVFLTAFFACRPKMHSLFCCLPALFTDGFIHGLIYSYDADTSPANFFLIRRQQKSTAPYAGLASPSPIPGGRGRWSLPEDLSGLESMTSMLHAVDVMSRTWSIYTYLQAVVLLILILRLIILMSFQPKLAIISGTLALMVPDFLHLLLIASISAVMYACMACILFGYRVGSLSTYNAAISTMLQYIVIRYDNGTMQSITNVSWDRSQVQGVLQNGE